jgi:hypothetical protein
VAPIIGKSSGWLAPLGLGALDAGFLAGTGWDFLFLGIVNMYILQVFLLCA